MSIVFAKRHTTSLNGDVFRVTGPLWRESGRFPSQRPGTRSLDVFVDLRLNKRLSKQSKLRWSETPSRSLWRHCDETLCVSQCPINNDTNQAKVITLLLTDRIYGYINIYAFLCVSFFTIYTRSCLNLPKPVCCKIYEWYVCMDFIMRRYNYESSFFFLRAVCDLRTYDRYGL